jgi:hypothetical protein
VKNTSASTALEEGGLSLQFLDHLCCTIGGPDAYKKLDKVRLDSQPENIPAFLFAFGLKKFLTAVLEFPHQNGLSSLGTPDEMRDNEMDSLLIPLVFKLARVCRFLSRWYTAKIDKLSIGFWLKPRTNPPIRPG